MSRQSAPDVGPRIGEFRVTDSTGFVFTYASQCEHQQAERPAKARQELAAKGTGYNPTREELTEDERVTSTVAPRHYLRAAINAGLLEERRGRGRLV